VRRASWGRRCRDRRRRQQFRIDSGDHHGAVDDDHAVHVHEPEHLAGASVPAGRFGIEHGVVHVLSVAGPAGGGERPEPGLAASSPY
jgi:hypothetical protein